jgi:hypothetical protein
MATDEFKIKSTEKWHIVHNEIFGNSMPYYTEWKSPNDIIRILQIIGKHSNSNHLFFPDGGGMDLRGAQESYEDGCIEIITGHTYVFRPKKLVYESIDKDLEWCYFRLINAGLEPTGVYKHYLRNPEEVLELRSFHFVDRVHWDEQQYDGEKLPKGARIISRILKGDLVIFKK